MLVLTRKEGESILLDENIEINIIQIAQGRVKIGINAPKSVQIMRKEVKIEIENENKMAVTLLSLIHI